MTFRDLHLRLVENLNQRVRGGEITERRLASLSGISQPHLHNALKGVRGLSPDLADDVLKQLGLSLLDLVGPEDWRQRERPQQVRTAPIGSLPVAAGLLGPGHSFPIFEAVLEKPFLASHLAGLVHPLALRLAGDPANPGFVREGDWLLVDRSEARRLHPLPQTWYVVDLGGHGAVRRVWSDGENLYCGAEIHGDLDLAWPCISLRDRNILDIVRASVVWIGRPLEFSPDFKR